MPKKKRGGILGAKRPPKKKKLGGQGQGRLGQRGEKIKKIQRKVVFQGGGGFFFSKKQTKQRNKTTQ